MPTIEIRIMMEEDGRVQFGANIQNTLQILGLLEMGKQAYLTSLQQAESRIVPATMVPPNLKLD